MNLSTACNRLVGVAVLVVLATPTAKAFTPNPIHNFVAPQQSTFLSQSTLITDESTPTTATTKPTSAAETYRGAGPVQDEYMNRYNLPLEEAAEEWTANLVAESSLQAEGVYLGAKNTRDHFADTVKLRGIPRNKPGLGIELLEIAGGREDGLGITIVSGLVEGGTCENSGIMTGDSVVKIAVERLVEETTEEVASINTECLGWDATVAAIGSLPPAESEKEEYLTITVKRLRRKPKVTVTFEYPPDQVDEATTIELFSGENLRRAMLVKGIQLNDPLSRRFDSGGRSAKQEELMHFIEYFGS